MEEGIKNQFYAEAVSRRLISQLIPNGQVIHNART